MNNQRRKIVKSNIIAIPFAVVFVTIFCVGAVRADDVREQLDVLRQRLDNVQKDTSEMRESLDELKAETQKDWITEQRADEIRSLVHDVLLDTDTRTSLVGDGLLGGWSDGFFLASSDGRFKLTIGGLVQERFIQSFLRSSNDDRWRGGLENTRTRLDIGGHVFDKDTTFLVQAGWGYVDPHGITIEPLKIDARLWDTWIKFKLSDQWSVKLGVFMLPFTRESLVSDKYQLAVDRSLIDYRLGLARSQGIEFTWANDDTRVFLATSNGSYALNGIDAATTEQPTPPWGALAKDAEWAFTARAEFLLEGNWSQFNQFTSPIGSEAATMIGVAVHGQQEERTGGGGVKQDQYGITADLSMNFDGMTFFVSGTTHNQKNIEFPNVILPNADWVGYVAQASTYMTDKTELFMRFEGGGVMQNTMGGDDVHILTAGVNWYLDGQGLKITSDYGWSFGEISSGMQNLMLGWRGTANHDAEWLFRTQLQLAF